MFGEQARAASERESREKHVRQLYFLIQLTKIKNGCQVRLLLEQRGGGANEDNLREFNFLFFFFMMMSWKV